MPNPPEIAPGRHCTDPVVCEFYARCNPPRPDDHIVFLPRLHANTMEQLQKMGVQSIHSIPDDFELTEIQRRAAIDENPHQLSDYQQVQAQRLPHELIMVQRANPEGTHSIVGEGSVRTRTTQPIRARMVF